MPRRAGGFDLYAFAFVQDLRDHFALDAVDDAAVEVVGFGAGVAEALADQLFGQTANRHPSRRRSPAACGRCVTAAGSRSSVSSSPGAITTARST